VKRRKFATALAFMVTLLVAALAAASVSAATSAPKAKQASGKGWELKTRKNQAVRKVGTGQFAPSGPNSRPFIDKAGLKALADKNSKFAKSVNGHDKAIPGKKLHNNPSGSSASSAAGSAAAPFIPHAPSLPIHGVTHQTVKTAYGLNAYDQDAFGAGYIDTPPDNALAEGNGFVFQAVNNVFAIYDTNFGHVLNVESMEAFWAPAILTTGYCSVSDPKAHYDTITRRWFVTEVAYGPPGCAPGSAVFIAVSTTSDPLSVYNIYVLDTSFDGTTCGPDGCIADQPLLGMNRNALFISTNSFDWDSPAFNGAQLYIIDSTALAFGAFFPNIVYFDIGANIPTPEGFDGCGFVGYPLSAYCWYSVQPGTSPNFTQVTSRGGTEFFMSALDWFGSVDNRIALWAVTNTSTISAFFPDMFINYAIANTQSYGFPFTDTPFFSPYAEQPSSGNTPLCDFFIGPFCEPGPIANNDDRMNEVKTVVPTPAGPAHNWGGVNTDALVGDPIGHLHRRSAIAYFDVQATAWFGPFIVGAAVANSGKGQGYVANWNNDVVFPAIAVGTAADENAEIIYSLTGNDHFPSVAISPVSAIPAIKPADIQVALPGQDVLDDFAWYFFGNPRFGDYSAAVGDGHTLFGSAEMVQYPSCDDATFLFDPTCGGTRSEFTNWGTGLVRINV
jgi:hypothetical protein